MKVSFDEQGNDVVMIAETGDFSRALKGGASLVAAESSRKDS